MVSEEQGATISEGELFDYLNGLIDSDVCDQLLNAIAEIVAVNEITVDALYANLIMVFSVSLDHNPLETARVIDKGLLLSRYMMSLLMTARELREPVETKH